MILLFWLFISNRSGRKFFADGGRTEMLPEMNPRLGGVGPKGKERYIGKLNKRTVHSEKFCANADVCQYWEMCFSVGLSPCPEIGCSMIKFSRHGRMRLLLEIK